MPFYMYLINIWSHIRSKQIHPWQGFELLNELTCAASFFSMIQFSLNWKYLRSNATYLPLFSFFLSPQCEDFHWVIQNLYFHVTWFFSPFWYVVSIENCILYAIKRKIRNILTLKLAWYFTRSFWALTVFIAYKEEIIYQGKLSIY